MNAVMNLIIGPKRNISLIDWYLIGLMQNHFEWRIQVGQRGPLPIVELAMALTGLN